MVYSGYERTQWLLDMDRNTYAVFLHLMIEYTCVIVHIWACHHRHWCIMPVGSIKRVISYIITNITRDVLPNINCTQATERAGKWPVLVPGDLDLWPWHSNASDRGTKYVFHVNLALIHSAVPEIFRTQTKTTDWRRQKRTFHSLLCAVEILRTTHIHTKNYSKWESVLGRQVQAYCKGNIAKTWSKTARRQLLARVRTTKEHRHWSRRITNNNY